MPRRKLKVGMSLWYVYADPEDGSELWEYVIRSIKKPPTRLDIWPRSNKKVYLIEKNSSTWVKKSRKHFDYGWADYIPDYLRKELYLDEYEKNGLQYGLSFTKSGAYNIAISNAKKYLKDMLADPDEDPEYIEQCKKIISRLKGLHTKFKKKKEMRK